MGNAVFNTKPTTTRTSAGRGSELAFAKLNLSSSYATGGDTIPIAAVTGGFNNPDFIRGILVGGCNNALYHINIVRSTSGGATTWKALATLVAGGEAANATNLSAVQIDLVIIFGA